MVKIVKFLVRSISKHPEKTIPLMFETETVETCLVRKLKWGALFPTAPLVATPLSKDTLNLFEQCFPIKQYIALLCKF